ncbi:ABC transporter ATP-binding protein [Micromonospora sp. KLBMP9576]|uniref:ABC transporter ATP-binding protein n=1 Tax=Micromonospora sp. KLBMP9576 TaxID=3424769 RepID=UPI003D917AEE
MRLLRDLWATSPRRMAVVTCLVVLGGVGQAAAAALAGPVLVHRAVGFFALLVVALVAAVITELVVSLLMAGLTADWSADVRRRLCRVALGQDLPSLETTPVGELLDRIDGDVYQVAAAVRGQGVRIAQGLAAGVLSTVVALAVWWPAGVGMLLLTVLLVIGLRGPAARIGPARMAEEEAWSDLAAVMEESIHGQDDVRTSLARPYVLRLYARRAAEVLTRGRRVWRMSAEVITVAASTIRVGIAAVVLGGAWALTTGRVDGARLTAVWLLAIGFGMTVEHISRMVPELQYALGAWGRVQLLADSPQEPVGGAAPTDGDLALRGLTFRYAGADDGRGPALRDVDLTFVRGRSYALVGRTGSGKSTLAKVLTRAVDVPPGTVFLAGDDLCDLDVEALRRWIAVVPQRTEILAGTLAENVALFDPDLLDAAVRALSELGLDGWITELPHGLDTRLGEGGHVLSAGQEQLVAFARILVRQPHVVILDEATARLDPVTEARVQRATERLLRDRIGIVIAHRLSSVHRCDEVVVMADGAVLEAGPLRSSHRFAELLATSHAAAYALAAPAGGAASAGRSGGVELLTGPSDRWPTGPGEADPPVPSPPGPPDEPGRRRTAGDQTGGDQTGGDRAGGDQTGGDRAGGDRAGGGRTVDGRAGAARPAETREPEPTTGDGPRGLRGLREILRLCVNDARYGLTSLLLFLVLVLIWLEGPVLPWLWADLVDGAGSPWKPALGIIAGLLVTLPLPYFTNLRFPQWWVRQMLRISLRLVHGQTGPRRVSRHTPAEVVAQGGDTERVVQLADNLMDQAISVLLLVAMTVVTGSLVPGFFFAGTMVVSGLAATLFGPKLERSARATVAARPRSPPRWSPRCRPPVRSNSPGPPARCYATWPTSTWSAATGNAGRSPCRSGPARRRRWSVACCRSARGRCS